MRHFGLNRRGGLVVERSPRMREIGVRKPVGTNLSRQNTVDVAR